jgi:FAD:protein FMN transferase
MRKVLAILLSAVLLLSSCGVKNNGPAASTEFLLGTICSVKIYGENGDEMLDIAFDEIRRLEALLSTGIKDSEISEINAAAGVSRVVVSEEVFGLIKRALEYSILTEGVFNLAVGPLTELWGIGTDNARVPSAEEIGDTLPLLDYSKVVLDEENNSVYLGKKGMALDLGAIAKGYIADCVAGLLRQKGVKSAILNLGGNVYVIGRRPDGAKWKIGIQDPFAGRNMFFSIYQAADETIVSSGVYERYFESEGKRYHHIFDCKTGYPVETGIYSVTVIGKNSETADALSTIVFSLGIEKGSEFIRNYPGYELVFVDKDRNVTVSENMSGNLEIADEDFKLFVHE